MSLSQFIIETDAMVTRREIAAKVERDPDPPKSGGSEYQSIRLSWPTKGFLAVSNAPNRRVAPTPGIYRVRIFGETRIVGSNPWVDLKEIVKLLDELYTGKVGVDRRAIHEAQIRGRLGNILAER